MIYDNTYMEHFPFVINESIIKQYMYYRHRTLWQNILWNIFICILTEAYEHVKKKYIYGAT